MKTLSPLCTECPEISEPQIPGNIQGLSGRVPGLLYLLHLSVDEYLCVLACYAVSSAQ